MEKAVKKTQKSKVNAKKTASNRPQSHVTDKTAYKSRKHSKSPQKANKRVDFGKSTPKSTKNKRKVTAITIYYK